MFKALSNPQVISSILGFQKVESAPYIEFFNCFGELIPCTILEFVDGRRTAIDYPARYEIIIANETENIVYASCHDIEGKYIDISQVVHMDYEAGLHLLFAMGINAQKNRNGGTK